MSDIDFNAPFEAQAALPKDIDFDAEPQTDIDFTKPPVTEPLAAEIAPAVIKGAQGLVASALKGSAFLGSPEFVTSTRGAMDRIDAGEAVAETDDPLGYQHMTSEQRQQARVDFEAQANVPPTDRLGYRVGQALEDLGKDSPLMKTERLDKEYKVTGDIARGLGSLVGGGAVSLIPGVGVPLAGAMFTTAGMGEAADRAVKHGATNEQIVEAARGGAIAGATDLADVLLFRFGGSTGRVLGFLNAIGRPAAATLKGVVLEGGQEGLQQFIQNAVARGVYKPEQNLFEDVPYNAMLGAIIGGPVSGLQAGRQVEREREARQAVPSPEVLMAAARELEGLTVDAPRPMFASRIDDSSEAGGPLWYSSLRRVVEESKQQSADSAQWWGMIRNSPGVKSEEIEAAGLDSWLAEVEGKVTKEQILAHLDENAVQVREIILSETPTWTSQDDARLSWLERYRNNLTESEQSERAELITRENAASEPGTGRPPALPQYAEYTTPGPRSGYRELLLMLPTEKGGVPIVEPLGNQFTLRWPNGAQVADSRGNPQSWYTQADAEQAARSFGRHDQGGYVSPHWNEPNVLAHVRFTDRVDASGAKLLFIEEVQSDWHQTGRKEGYKRLDQPRSNILEAERKREQAWNDFERVGLEGGLDRHILNNMKRQLEYEGEQAHFYGQYQGLDRLRELMRRHYPDNDLGARLAIRASHYVEMYEEFSKQQDAQNKGVPDAPFKTSWPELSFKRMLRWAADNGYQRIAWTTGEQQVRRYGHELGDTGERAGNLQRGMVEFYDKMLPSIARKWAKRLGGRYGTTRLQGLAPNLAIEEASHEGAFYVVDIETGRAVDRHLSRERAQASITRRQELGGAVEVQYIEVPPSAMSIVRRGLPLFSRTENGTATGPIVAPTGVQYPPEIRRIPEIIQELNRKFEINAPITFRYLVSEAVDNRTAGQVTPEWDGSYTIEINLSLHDTTSQVYATAMHEFGHVVMLEKFAYAPQRVQQAIRDAYVKFRDETVQTDALAALWRRRDNAIVNHYMLRGAGKRPLYALDPQTREYWSSFDEWFAEQVAKWATTDAKPISIAEKYIAGLANVLRRIFMSALRAFNLNARPEQVMADWLNSFITDAPPIGHEVISELDRKTRISNETALEKIAPEVPGVEQQGETSSTRRKLNSAFDDEPTPEGLRVMAASADRMSKFYKWMIGVGQLARLNRQNVPLQQYVAAVHEMMNDENRIYDYVLRVQKAWRRLGTEQGDNVAKLIDDVMNMTYRTDDEVTKGVARHPTPQEFADLVARHKVNAEGVEVFRRIRTAFDTFLTFIEEEAVKQAERLTEPLAKAQAIETARAHFKALRSRPYFPAMRFGHHFIVKRNAAGHVTHFETVEGTRVYGLHDVTARARQRERHEALERTKEDGETVQSGELPEQVRPLIGMPPALLDLISEKLELSAPQRDALEQLRFEMSPAQSFKHRFQHKQFTPGYSEDFKRAFAHYFFYGAKFYSKVKHIDSLRNAVAAIRANARTLTRSNKTDKIANYLDDHLQNEIISPKAAITWLHGLTFFYGLGYSIAAATLNLSQVPTISFPFLAAKFGGLGLGDARSATALANAARKLGTYYKKGNLKGLTQFDLQALNYAVRTGAITEAMAPEIAALSEGNNLLGGVGKTKIGEMAFWAYEKASFVFEMAEQWNRRVTFRAALELAMRHPETKWIDEVVAANQEEFARLRGEFTEQQARAILAAKEAVKQTQYEYGRAFSPRFMRGKARAFFIFKSYMQNTLFLMSSNPSVGARWLLIMMFLGGLGGIPGADDAKELARALAYLRFGKDFNLERAVREYLREMGAGTNTDIILHGMARRGFKISDVVGAFAPYPVFDRSRAMTMGSILPVELGKIFGPPTKGGTDKVIAEQTQRASGAGFGLFFNLYKFLADDDLEIRDPKRWERILPRAFRDVSRAGRYATEGQERNRRGSRVVSFDVRDTEQLMEVIGTAMGYNPLRLQLEWEKRIMLAEYNSARDIRRAGVLRQAFEARRSGDEKELENMKRAINRFNTELPEWDRAQRITSDTLKRSFDAKQRERAAQETGVPVQKSKRGAAEHIRGLFPEAQIFEERRVR